MRRAAVRVFAELRGGGWLPVGSARVRCCRGRQTLRVELDALPTTGKLCISLADVAVLQADEAQAPGAAAHDKSPAPARPRPNRAVSALNQAGHATARLLLADDAVLVALYARDDAALEAAALRVTGQPTPAAAVAALLRLHLDAELSAARSVHKRVGHA